MTTRLIQRIIQLSIIALSLSTAIAQRTGNVVEYFGKEKVETTDEGLIYHQFTKGLALRNAMPSGSLFVGQDILAWQLANGTFVTPAAGQKLPVNYPRAGIPLSWETVKVDSTGTFRDTLQNAYLYTSLVAPAPEIVLLDASGHTRVYINGMPHEGDHYDYGHTLIPFRLRKGLNEFIYTPGRFGRVKSKLILPNKPFMLCRRDLTMPSIIRGEAGNKWAAIRVVNASEQDVRNLTIVCTLASGEKASCKTGSILALSVRKVKFLIPAPKQRTDYKQVTASVVLLDESGCELDRCSIILNQRDKNTHHERTFVSNIDGSVQYYSVVPSLSDVHDQAFILSVHGASVEATSQARAYKQKEWAYIVAPTNRRPFGFNWEEWGRIDALEVMEAAKKIFNTSPSKTYLTGHSMGGHGSWFLGATYPDRFAAIAPCAGYPDIIGYRKDVDTANIQNKHYEMIKRGANPGRVLNLLRNYLQSGVYVLHGSADQVVPVSQARMMREELGKFHNNFCYYEYPDGSHWYGDHSMDWPPLFDFLRQNRIPSIDSVRHLEFRTASPGVSSRNYWLEVIQQIDLNQVSTVIFDRISDTIRGTTQNVECLKFFIQELQFTGNPVLVVDGQTILSGNRRDILLKLNGKTWNVLDAIAVNEKYPSRHGGFKMAFTNKVILVYATKGTIEENEWYKNRARFDAETFLYRGNGSFDVVADKDFEPEKYKDRNVIIYGNADNNLIWNLLLGKCPVQVSKGKITLGDKTLYGDDLGTFFIYPRPDSPFASIGVISATGKTGMKGAFANSYFSGVTGYPDLLIFSVNLLKDGLDGMKVSGFFNNRWGLDGANTMSE